MKGRIIKLTAVLASAVIGITGCGVPAVDQSMPEVVAVSGAVDESADVAKGAPEDGTPLAQVPAESEGKTVETEKPDVNSEPESKTESEAESNTEPESKTESKTEPESEAVVESKPVTTDNKTTKEQADSSEAERQAAAKAEAERQAAEKAAREEAERQAAAKAEAERQAAEKAAREEAERQAAASQGQSSAINQVAPEFQNETPEERQARLDRQAAEAAQKSAEYEAAKKAAEEEAARKAAEEEAARQQEQQYSETYSCECGHWSYTIHSADELDAFYTALDAHQSECGSGRFGGGVN